MSKLRVGIDIDGVLRDFVAQVCEVYFEHTLGHVDEYDLSNWGFVQKYYIDGESLANKIWGTGELAEDVFYKAPAYTGTKTAYQQFCDDPNMQVYIVSSQPNGLEEYTDRWLKDHGFDKHYSTIYTGKKLEAPCQALIDDGSHNIKEYEENLRTGIIIDRPWNRKYDHPLRAQDLFEAYNILSHEK